MDIDRLRSLIEDNRDETTIMRFYGAEAVSQTTRYRKLLETTMRRFHPADVRVFSSPGRTELGGNHTDHNGGKVLAASVQLDSIAMVERTEDPNVVLQSDRYTGPIRVNLTDLRAQSGETGRTEALVRGIAARLVQNGHRIGGFRGCISSNVLPGSGLSSSASIEILVGSIFNSLFNRGALSPTELAQAGQYAENHYFGKPCGLMDQVACATGGIVAIDFQRPEAPIVRRVDAQFEDYGLSIVVVDTGGSHEDLTSEYAAVPDEMRSVAHALGRRLCRELTAEEVLREIPALRVKLGDRAILRCLHFFADNARVDRQVEALSTGDIESYLEAVRQAGDSSWELLQNNYPAANVREQGVPLAMALSRRFLGDQAAVRIQGGGFAGTMQAYVPLARLDEYRSYMEGFFGPASTTPVHIRSAGAIEVF